ncbi:uncharacterized protein LOC128880751 [Hylaeus volcanicus]|uniref:uncharacterized protein LOC128880751 n=1 Tax=Hylaeus volcanicus TaxID=313075 RepID=UPI0023B820D7|nr:uncharacterized protein LOC128880751 [Hylaeus volcanicus]
MAHGVSEVLGEGNSVKMVHQKQQQQSVVHQQQQNGTRKSVGVMGSRRIFAPAFKLKVLDSYRNDIDCRGNQRATARKYGIHRRQIQKWLQCEDNLRNSCAETGNSGVVSSTVISSAGVSKSDGTVTEGTGPAVTPAAPALNLSLTRLHGDELATQQGPPPLLSRPPHGGSGSSPQYAAQSTTVPVLSVRLGYQEYSGNQEPHHLRRVAEDRAQITDSVHEYSETRGDREQVGYYVLNGDGQREIETSTSFDGRNEAKVYQTLTSYRVPSHQAHRYKENEIIGAMVHHRQEHRSPSLHRSQQTYGDVDSSVDGKSSYGLLLAPSMIKTERASPDSAATPGPCESTCSPGAPKVPLSPVSHRANSTTSTSSTTSVHFDSPRASVSPCLHVHEHAHAYASPTPDSKKSIQESNETTVRIEEKGTEDVVNEAKIGRTVIKEELHFEEEGEEEDKEEEETNDEGREADASSYVDYQRAPADSRPVSPANDPEGYSLPSSPRDPASSGRSSTSCSDSEMDPLDCSSGGHNSSNDLARRRSFSLRFKLDVLDAFHRDVGVAGNQRATARKFGINRRQVQKWLGQETELRGEIAVRGNSRQRLGPIQDAASGESPVDLRTSNYVSNLSHDRIEAEYDLSPPPLYCCDVGFSSSQHLSYYHHSVMMDPSSESEPAASCNLSCCMDVHATTPAPSCYQETSLRGSCYSDPQNRLYCYSPREYSSEITSVPETTEEFSSSKRQHCTLACCYEGTPSPKRICLETDETIGTSPACQEAPPQDTPLCLVKPKRLFDSPRSEPVTSTVPTPPASTAPPPPEPISKKDAILFKPYLDNPVSKPAKEHSIQRGLSPVSSQNVVNNNNNCQSICNLNESRGHDYALELSLRLPVSWRTHPSPYTEFPQVKSAFVRYPASPHYS